MHGDFQNLKKKVGKNGKGEHIALQYVSLLILG